MSKSKCLLPGSKLALKGSWTHTTLDFFTPSSLAIPYATPDSYPLPFEGVLFTNHGVYAGVSVATVSFPLVNSSAPIEVLHDASVGNAAALALTPAESETVPMVARVTSPASVSRRLRIGFSSHCFDVVVFVSVMLGSASILMKCRDCLRRDAAIKNHFP